MTPAVGGNAGTALHTYVTQGAAGYEYAEEYSIGRVNRLAADGWTVHTAGTLPSGDRWYLMQREKT